MRAVLSRPQPAPLPALLPEETPSAPSRTARSTAAVRLTLLVAFLSVIATTSGLVWRATSTVAEVTTVAGGTVELYGHGLYRNDSVFRAAGNIGGDWVTLVAIVPLLLLAVRAHHRGSRAGSLVLTGLLTWFVYLYASLSLGTAHNELFLVYVALVSTSTAALAATLRAIDLAEVAPRLLDEVPVRALGTFLLATAGLTAYVWLEPELTALLAGEPPSMLLHSTTVVTDVLDLAFITPSAVVAGVLLRRRRPEGYLFAVPLLGLLVVLGPVIVAQTVVQLAAGWRFTGPELVGPLGGFLVAGSLAAWFSRRILVAVGTADGPRH